MTKEDNDKISEIICDVWKDLLKDPDAWDDDIDLENEGIDIWISYFMTYGFSPNEILAYGKEHGLKYAPWDCDPNDPDDVYGALIITQKDIDKIQ